MAVTVTATPDPAFARVRLTVAGAANGPVSITRLDGNGSHPVRQAAGSASAGGSLLVDDYEAALRGDLTYTAVDQGGASGSRTVVAALNAVTSPWLSHPNLPALNMPVRIAADLPSWAPRSTQHLVYGRAAPIYTTQPMQARTGALTLLCVTWAESEQVRALYAGGNAVLLRNPCLGGADYYHVAELRARPRDEGAADAWSRPWVLEVSYTAVDQPAGELQGSPDWTWDRLVSAEPSWGDVVAAYPTWADLVQGPAPS